MILSCSIHSKSLTNFNMNDLKAVACSYVDSNSVLLNNLSQEIWRNPELSNAEFKAHDFLTGFLESEGFDVHRNYILETGFKATFTKGDLSSSPNIAFLCEYDALPGIGHACGHNLIAEVGIGAALAVKAALESSDGNRGVVTIFGTPAEESTGGKLDFVSGGAFDDVDVALMAHPAHFAASKPVFSALQDVNVTYFGKESHAASNPWEGVNALDAAVLSYTSISCLRQQIHESSRIHGIIIRGGEATNIIPRIAEVKFCVRSSTYQRLFELKDRVEACFRGAAVASGCEANIDWSPKKFLPVESDANLLKIYEENSVRLGTVFTFDKELLNSTTGSTDMGNVSHVVPSLHPYFNIGDGFKEHTLEFARQAGSSEVQTATLREAKVLACVAVELFCQPGLVETIKSEFRQRSFYQEYLRERNNI